MILSVQASVQLQAPQLQLAQVAGQPYIQVLETLKKLLEDFEVIHADACHGFKASTTVLAAVQGLAALAVTGLGIAAAALDHPPKTLNILTAALGAIGGGVASLSKWRNYAGKAAFNEEAASFYTSGVNNLQSVLDENQLSPQPAPFLMRAINTANAFKNPKAGTPGAIYQNARKSLARR